MKFRTEPYKHEGFVYLFVFPLVPGQSLLDASRKRITEGSYLWALTVAMPALCCLLAKISSAYAFL